MKRLLLSMSLVAACGGAPKYTMSVSTRAALAAKSATCDFRVVNMPPNDGEYEEIATLTPPIASADSAANPEEFRKAVASDVCKIGGDVVVTEVNGYGWYVRGTVLRRRVNAAAAQ